MLAELPPDDERLKEIPRGCVPQRRRAKRRLATPFTSILPTRDSYVCVNALDMHPSTTGPPSAATFGYPTRVYKVVSHRDGLTYALRRVDKLRTTPEIASQVRDMWARVPHPNIVVLRDAFLHTGGAHGGWCGGVVGEAPVIFPRPPQRSSSSTSTGPARRRWRSISCTSAARRCARPCSGPSWCRSAPRCV